MTGAFFRVKRNGKFENVELEFLTPDERSDIIGDRGSDYLLSCIDLLSDKVRQFEPPVRSKDWPRLEKTDADRETVARAWACQLAIQKLIDDFEADSGVKVQIGIRRHNSWGPDASSTVWMMPVVES